MPSGGTWIAQNKVRPGAYINFVSVPKKVGTLGERGTVAIGLRVTNFSQVAVFLKSVALQLIQKRVLSIALRCPVLLPHFCIVRIRQEPRQLLPFRQRMKMF